MRYRIFCSENKYFDKLYEDLNAYKQKHPDTNEGDLIAAIRMDPTSHNDNEGTYSDWILNLIIKDGKSSIDWSELREALDFYDKNKKLFKSQNINTYRSIEELQQEIDKIQEQSLHNIKNIVYEKGDWIIYVFNDFDSFKKVCEYAKPRFDYWDEDYFFNRHIKDDAYVCLNKDTRELLVLNFVDKYFKDEHNYGVRMRDLDEDIYDFFFSEENQSKFLDGLDIDEVYNMLDEKYTDYAEKRIKEEVKKIVESGFSFSIDGSDLEKGHTEVSSEFLDSCISGDVWDYFSGYSESSDPSDFIGYVEEEILEKHGFTKEILKDIIEDKDDIRSSIGEETCNNIEQALTWAGDTGLADGACEEALNDFNNALKEAIPEGCELERNGDDLVVKVTPKFLDNCDYEEVWNQLGYYCDTTKEALLNSIKESITDNFNFSEPHYGWNGFNENSFNDSLDSNLDDTDLPEFNMVELKVDEE